MQLTETHEAYEVLVGGTGDSDVLLTCEHASNRLPADWSWTPSDRRLVDTHWAIDRGAATLARELAAEINAACVLARFTRLLVDPNRPLDSDTLFRSHCDGIPLDLNQELPASERRRRIGDYYTPLHEAIDRASNAVRPSLLVSIHSFTPVYEGQQREVQVGILHVDQPERAQRWSEGCSGHGFDVRINEPYSGMGGMMYSPWMHALRAGCPALELEVRHDVARDPVARGRLRALLVQQLLDT